MLIINLFAGPGSGKSTTCAGIFYKLKMWGVNCEMVLEYAKDKVWENSLDVLNDQIYVFGKQQHRLKRLIDKVDVVITDSPLLLSIVYNKEKNEVFNNLVIQEFNKFDTLNFYIVRPDTYQTQGRLQTLEEAIEKDDEVKQLLDKYNIDYKIVNVDDSVITICNDICNKLNNIK
jgi:cell fate (sporulation/competence/biofilm development) regulator YlbF (YheA/YmcA/DUF963 family)